MRLHRTPPGQQMSDPARVVVPGLTLDQLVSRPVPIPPLHHVRRLRPPAGPSRDVRADVERELATVLDRVSPGDAVAIGVGSRGVARLQEIVGSVVEVLRERGARPYIVPAMGSHGGATEDGQLAVLAGLGITEASMGVPLEASMSTRLAGVVDEIPVHIASSLDRAQHVLVINRIKSHTSFSGMIESGLAKMLAIGLGKQRGAEKLHELGPLFLEQRIVTACSLLIQSLPVLGGLAVVEDERKAIDLIELVPPDGIGGAHETALLARARGLEARLPFDSLDVLIVDLMGKEISGTGMDTNVLGRRMVRGSPEPAGPQVTNVVVLQVSTGSGGNAVGIGLADFIPRAALEGVDLASTYANAFTAGLQGVQRAQIPIVLSTDRDAVGAALVTAGIPDLAKARIARIRSTLALDELMVSANLLQDPRLEELSAGALLDIFDATGALLPWPAIPTPTAPTAKGTT